MPYKAEIDYFLSHARVRALRECRTQSSALPGRLSLPMPLPSLLLDDWLDKVADLRVKRLRFVGWSYRPWPKSGPLSAMSLPTTPTRRCGTPWSQALYNVRNSVDRQVPSGLPRPGRRPRSGPASALAWSASRLASKSARTNPLPSTTIAASLLKQVQASAAAWDRVWLLDVAVAPGLDATACLADLVADGIRPGTGCCQSRARGACSAGTARPRRGQVFGRNRPRSRPHVVGRAYRGLRNPETLSAAAAARRLTEHRDRGH